MTSSMSYIVKYIGKDGKSATSPAFGDRRVAEAYARGVKAATVEETAVAAPAVTATRVAEGTAEAQRASTRAYFAQIAAPTWRSPEQLAHAAREARDFEIENAAERSMEAFHAARHAGASVEDAWSDHDYAMTHDD